MLVCAVHFCTVEQTVRVSKSQTHGWDLLAAAGCCAHVCFCAWAVELYKVSKQQALADAQHSSSRRWQALADIAAGAVTHTAAAAGRYNAAAGAGRRTSWSGNVKRAAGLAVPGGGCWACAGDAGWVPGLVAAT